MYNQTDGGNARFFADQLKQILRYNHRRGRWLIWHKHWWEPDPNGEVVRLALAAIKERRRLAESITDAADKRSEISWTLKSESKSKLDAMVSIAANLGRLADKGDHWDEKPYLLGLQNGVLDLKTGKLRDGERQDRITRQCPFNYCPGADYQPWIDFVARAMDYDTDLIDWLQRAVGYSLTGITTEKMLFFCHGEHGNNGKSTFLETIAAMLGSYAYPKFPMNELMERRTGSTATPNIAKLPGVRFVLGSEIGEDKRINESLVKDLTGGIDTINARDVWEKSFTFTPQFKLWLFGNYKPVIRGTDDAIWDRIGLIPWTVTIPPAERNKGLGDDFMAHLPLIFNWAYQGTQAYLRKGLDLPACMTAERTSYRAEMNPLQEWAEECLTFSDTLGLTGASIEYETTDDVYSCYRLWAQGKAIPDRFMLGRKTFTRRLESMGVSTCLHGPARTKHWKGLRLSATAPEVAEYDVN